MEANDTQVGGNHYKGKKFQPWDWDKYGIGTFEMDILHYVTRQKNGQQDLEKAVHYCEKLLEEYSRFSRRNRVPGALQDRILPVVSEYCDEWSMVGRQRAIIGCLLLWQSDMDILRLKHEIQLLIQETYGATDDVPATLRVESPKA